MTQWFSQPANLKYLLNTYCVHHISFTVAKYQQKTTYRRFIWGSWFWRFSSLVSTFQLFLDLWWGSPTWQKVYGSTKFFIAWWLEAEKVKGRDQGWDTPSKPHPHWPIPPNQSHHIITASTMNKWVDGSSDRADVTMVQLALQAFFSEHSCFKC